jgi:type III pantothenate kinase
MLLTIDIGNTETVVGVFSQADLTRHWRLSTVASRTADEHALLLDGLLGLHGLDFDSITGVAISSVVPRLTQTLRETSQQHLGTEPVMIGPGVVTGIPITTENPSEVGADRVVNAVAARDLYGAPSIVVDFGTATTIDVISPAGELIGNAIAPGIQISVNALADLAAQLRRVELVAPPSVIGRNTVESLQSGILYGFAGQVDGIVRRMQAEMGAAPVTIATGGLAPVVLDLCETITHHDPWLTLHGLRIVYERNTQPDPAHPGPARPASTRPASTG